MTKLVQIIPVRGVRLFGKMIKKEKELRGQGTFYKSGPKELNRARWSHTKYKGWIKLQRTVGEIVSAEILSRSESKDEWQLFHAFIGWLDRYFGEKIQSLNIQYRE